MTSVPHTARISDVESVLCGDGIRKMVNVELSRQIKKGVNSFIKRVGQRNVTLALKLIITWLTWPCEKKK